MTFFDLVLAIISAIILVSLIPYFIALIVMVFMGIWTVIEWVWNKITK